MLSTVVPMPSRCSRVNSTGADAGCVWQDRHLGSGDLHAGVVTVAFGRSALGALPGDFSDDGEHFHRPVVLPQGVRASTTPVLFTSLSTCSASERPSGTAMSLVKSRFHLNCFSSFLPSFLPSSGASRARPPRCDGSHGSRVGCALFYASRYIQCMAGGREKAVRL